MVRLVFRPYTQVWRSICTSEPLRASIRVSPDFTLLGHSSPSFGSQRICSYSNLLPKLRIGRWCILFRGIPPRLVSLRLWMYCFPKTHTCVALLGPCFKTGWFWAFRSCLEGAAQSKGKCFFFDIPQSNSDRKCRSYNIFLGTTFFHTLLPKSNSHELGMRLANQVSCKTWQQISPTLLKNGYPPNNFKFFWLPLQGPFHLSLTVLVRYRSLVRI